MDDRQFEDRLRRALHAEVEHLPVSVTAPTVLRRSLHRQRTPRLAWAAVAMAAALIAAAGIFAAVNRPGPALVGGTPTPSTVPSATPSALAGDESAGRLRVEFRIPAMAETTVGAVCTWANTQPVRVARIESRDAGELQILGESLGVTVNPLVDPLIEPHMSAVLISRTLSSGEERAPYAPEAGDPLTVSGSSDGPSGGSSGVISFVDIDTVADDTPVDVLPVPRAEFGRPLGDDPSAARISGTIAWDCDPAQAAFDPLPPPSSEPPVDTSLWPTMELRASTETRTGVTLCGGWYVGDYLRSDRVSCAPAWVSPNDYPEPLPVEPGGELRLGSSAGWGLRTWRIVASTYEEIERTFGDPAAELVLSEKSGEGTISDLPAAFQAPTTPGTWIVRAEVSLRGQGALEAAGTQLFLLRIERP